MLRFYLRHAQMKNLAAESMLKIYTRVDHSRFILQDFLRP